METLNGKRVAILATDGFEQSELTDPLQALHDAGAETCIVSLHPGTIQGWKQGAWADLFKVDETLDTVQAKDFDALVLPGGVLNPDKLRQDQRGLSFVREFFDQGKPVGAICHGSQTLIDAGVLEGRKLTSYPSLQIDLRNAGAQWVDEEVVVDQGLVTSRTPDDLPAFTRRLIEEIAEGQHVTSDRRRTDASSVREIW